MLRLGLKCAAPVSLGDVSDLLSSLIGAATFEGSCAHNLDEPAVLMDRRSSDVADRGTSSLTGPVFRTLSCGPSRLSSAFRFLLFAVPFTTAGAPVSD